jgi:hypothetical protein
MQVATIGYPIRAKFGGIDPALLCRNAQRLGTEAGNLSRARNGYGPVRPFEFRHTIPHTW